MQADNSHWAERQIAIVMAATDCTRSEAKAALASCHQHCRTAILMLLSGLDAWHARGAANQTSRSSASRPA
ncbi:Glucokinase regulatory protein [Klebsiella pneumoniae IS46]|nr:Glucokinase regulatory protein [Klebsiella pneumoniae IS46]